MTTVIVKNNFPALVRALTVQAPLEERQTAARLAQKAREGAPTRTGKLKASIQAVGSAVVATVPYAGYQEYGTQKMEAHPYFFRPVDQEAARFTSQLYHLIQRYA